VFSVFHGPHSDLFDVDSPSGIVRVKQIVDRDVICYKKPTCVIPLDVAIIRPSTYFRVCAPRFNNNNTAYMYISRLRLYTGTLRPRFMSVTSKSYVEEKFVDWYLKLCVMGNDRCSVRMDFAYFTVVSK